MTTHPTMTTTFESAMLSFSPGVNSRAELVTLAPGLRPGSGMIKSSGPRMLPWGTPDVTGDHMEAAPSINHSLPSII